MMRSSLGDNETERLRAAYRGRVPGGADLVCFWFEQARYAIINGRAERAGLVATNSIRGGANRFVLDSITDSAAIFDAWSDEPWTVEGAAVRVAIVCFGQASAHPRLNGIDVANIPPNLMAAQNDLMSARQLSSNFGIAIVGTQKNGPFDIGPDTARQWLIEPSNANGRPNADVVKPWRNALHVTRRFDDAWVIDFGTSLTEREAAYYSKPFVHVTENVRPARLDLKRDQYRRLWWLHAEPRSSLRKALAPLKRYIATPRVAKHRVFVWLEIGVLPDCALVVIARDDDTTFGILHSRFHEAWSLRLCTWLGVGNDARYTPTTTFETFPFPENLTPNIQAATYAQNPHAIAIATAARALLEARDRWLNPENLTDRVPDILPHLPHRIIPKSPEAARQLKSRTLTNLYNTRGKPEGAWLDALHADLDAAVAAAYGWDPKIPESDFLAALLALNLARAAPPKRNPSPAP